MSSLTGESLNGKVAIITGAGQGIGRGIALALAKEGAAVVIAGRTVAKVEAVASEIQGFGGRACAVECNVKLNDDLARLTNAAVEAFGGIDVLVNNAQEVAIGPLLDLADDKFKAGIASGPMATLRLMKLCHPHMKARDGGSIINLATAAAVRWDVANYGAYAAVKQAIRSLTRAASGEWGRDNIRVNSIAPYALSEASREWIAADPERGAQMLKQIPLGRLGDCEMDIGRFVAFLVGPDASFVNGITIPIDGGIANFD